MFLYFKVPWLGELLTVEIQVVLMVFGCIRYFPVLYNTAWLMKKVFVGQRLCCLRML